MSVHGIRANTNRMEFVKCRNVSEGYPYISSQLILERSQLRLLLLFSFYMGKVVLKNLSELYSVMTLDSKGVNAFLSDASPCSCQGCEYAIFTGPIYICVCHGHII